MKGQRIGYIRVSSADQNVARQLSEVSVDCLFTDYVSGKDLHRPELEKLLAFIREGDTLVVHSMDRLARNLDDLRKIVHDLVEEGIEVQFIKENIIFNGHDTPTSILLLSVLGAFAEFERSFIKERQREGIEQAKKRGAYKGRVRSLTEEQAHNIIDRVAAGEKKSPLAREYGISRETLYQYLRRGK